MTHVLGEVYHLACQMSERRAYMERQESQKGSLVFIAPRVPQEGHTVIPSDTNTECLENTKRIEKADDPTENWCIIM